MKSHEKALRKKKGREVNNLVKGNEGDVGKNDKKPSMPYKFLKYKGAKNEDSEDND